MKLNANSLQVNLLITGLVLVMVFVLPWVDRFVCRKLGLNLEGGVSPRPDAERLLRLRQCVLYALFGGYLFLLAWVAFFSRSAASDYRVHVALFEDLQKSVRIDFGFLETLRILFTEGFREAFSHIRVVKAADIAQVYMNVLLFVPLGYLLPYLFPFFRARVSWLPTVTGFLLSLFIENLQLITRRGFYDMDDLVSNTLGAFLGQILFVAFAYVVTHPLWRQEVQSYRRWKRNARKRTLYPFARRVSLSRTELEASSEEEIWDFYVMKLGFRLKKQLVPLDSPGTDLLLEMGRLQVAVHCVNHALTRENQGLTLSVRKLRPILRRLEENGIPTGPVTQDPFTGLRCVCFSGPDNVRITVIEK